MVGSVKLCSIPSSCKNYQCWRIKLCQLPTGLNVTFNCAYLIFVVLTAPHLASIIFLKRITSLLLRVLVLARMTLIAKITKLVYLIKSNIKVPNFLAMKALAKKQNKISCSLLLWCNSLKMWKLIFIRCSVYGNMRCQEVGVYGRSWYPIQQRRPRLFTLEQVIVVR